MMATRAGRRRQPLYGTAHPGTVASATLRLALRMQGQPQ